MDTKAKKTLKILRLTKIFLTLAIVITAIAVLMIKLYEDKMKVIIKNKFFSLGGSSSVKNENGEDVFFVKGKVLSPTHVKWVCDLNKNKLFKVRNKWFNFINERAYVYEGKSKIAKVKHPFLSGKKFVVEGYKDEILIDGDFFSLKSTITRNGKPVGTINREFTVINDTFVLEADEADMPFMIALIIAIDNIRDKIQRKK